MKDNNVKALEELRTYNSSLDKEKHQFFLQVSEQILSDIIEKLGDKPLPDYYFPDAFRKLFEYEFAFGRKLSSSPDLDYINKMGLRGATDCCIRCFTDESWKSMLDLLNE